MAIMTRTLAASLALTLASCALAAAQTAERRVAPVRGAHHQYAHGSQFNVIPGAAAHSGSIASVVVERS